ncbi:MAG TPA: hypothetical protein VIE12_08445 [Actinomycetota bacterium]
MSGRGVNAIPGRPEGEGSSRIEERELQEAARRHEMDEQLHAHDPRRSGFFSRLFRRDRSGK